MVNREVHHRTVTRRHKFLSPYHLKNGKIPGDLCLQGFYAVLLVLKANMGINGSLYELLSIFEFFLVFEVFIHQFRQVLFLHSLYSLH